MIKKGLIIGLSIGFLIGAGTSQYAKRIIPAVKDYMNKRPIEDVVNDIKESVEYVLKDIKEPIKKYDISGFVKFDRKVE